MKKPWRVALAGGGKFTDSSLSRFPGLAEHLGPVKAASMRLSSRIVNYLGAGYPVSSYEEFEGCAMVLISVPDQSAAGVIEALADSKIEWPDKSVMLCSDRLGSAELQPLARAGAWPGSLCPIPGFDDRWYLAEGEREALRQAKRLVERRGARVAAIGPGLKPLYLAALTCSWLSLGATVAASDCLRHAGIPSGEAASIVVKQAERTLRSFLKSGRKSFRQPPRPARELALAHPELLDYLEASLRAARLLFSSEY